MLEVFREIEQSGEPIQVTDRGRPVLEVRPIASGPLTEDVLRALRVGPAPAPVDEADLLMPLPEEEWDALKR